MKPSLTDVLPLLNANCGDVLKVALLQEFFPTLPKINPMWLKAPTGDVEAAFAAMKAVQEPETRAQQLEKAIRADHVKDQPEKRFVDPVVSRLVEDATTAKVVGEMPAGIRFEDVDTTAIARPEPKPEPETITLEDAAARFNYSYVGLANRLRKAGIEGVKKAGHGRTLFFDLAKVSEEVAAKGSHRK